MSAGPTFTFCACGVHYISDYPRCPLCGRKSLEWKDPAEAELIVLSSTDKPDVKKEK